MTIDKLKDIKIDSFKGFEQFSVSKFNNFNLVVGSNNYGKTSLLEAIYLIKYLDDDRIFQFARLRDKIRSFADSISTYTAFLNLFHKTDNEDGLHFSISYDFENTNLNCFVKGQVRDTLAEKFILRDETIPYMNEIVNCFTGSIIVNSNHERSTHKLNLFEYESGRIEADEIKVLPIKYRNENITYISNFERTFDPSINTIIENNDVKKEIIEILNDVFDEQFSDIKILQGKFGEYYKAVSIGNKNYPLNSFGEGVRQAILLMNGILASKDGILLIDEIEGGLHKKAVDCLMPALLKYAKLYNVQIIATTHSEEVVDSVLGTYEDDDSTYLDDIRILRIIRHEDGEKQCLVRTGKEALKLRRDAGVDLG